MFISPEFPLRSGFPGTIQLIIATGILFRISNDCKIEMLTASVKILLLSVSRIFLLLQYLYRFIIFQIFIDRLKV